MKAVKGLRLPEGWQATADRGAGIEVVDEVWRFSLSPGNEGYVNAQVDDYRDLKRSKFLANPPLSLEAEIRWNNEEPLGTSGIGFWNDPFMMTGWRWPSLPKVIWFLMAGPDSEMKVGQASGKGLKAQVINAWNPKFWTRFPLLILGPLWGKGKRRSQCLDFFRRTAQVSEVELPEKPGRWRHFRLDWKQDQVEFFVDSKKVLVHPHSIKGPLGFVLWQDNQWMRFDPTGQLSWGNSFLKEKQAMDVRSLSLTWS